MGCGASVKKGEEHSSQPDDAVTVKQEDDAVTVKKEEQAEAGTAVPEAEAEDSEDEDEEAEDEEEMAKKMQARSQKKGRSQGICAESTERDPDWVAPVHEKTEEQEARLKSALSKSFIFNSLQQEDLETVIKAFMAHPVTAGHVIITQGAEVNSEEPALFVLEEGKADVYKTGIEEAIFTYTHAGQYFGELALLYTCARAATVTAQTDCTLWAIDRNTFNYLVKDAARQAKERRVDFLKKVPLLENLSDDDVYKLSDAFEVMTFAAGVNVINQGESASGFYILEQGSAVAMKGEDQVYAYDKGGAYFGELSLLCGQARAATVTTTSDCRILKLDGDGFERLIPTAVRKDMAARANELYGIGGKVSE